MGKSGEVYPGTLRLEPGTFRDDLTIDSRSAHAMPNLPSGLQTSRRRALCWGRNWVWLPSAGLRRHFGFRIMTPTQNSLEKQHAWEIVKMSDGRRVKRCRLCLYAYEFGHDLPCPAEKVSSDEQIPS